MGDAHRRPPEQACSTAGLIGLRISSTANADDHPLTRAWAMSEICCRVGSGLAAGEGDDGGGIARRGEAVGDVVLDGGLEMWARPRPEGDKQAAGQGSPMPRPVHHRRHGADEAAHHPPAALC